MSSDGRRPVCWHIPNQEHMWLGIQDARTEISTLLQNMDENITTAQ